jgi:cytochrome c1
MAMQLRTLITVLCIGGCAEAPSPADADRGRRLIAQYQCGTCHIIPGVDGARGHVAVTLKHFGLRSYIAGRIPNNDEHLVRWIMQPESLVPGTLMPSMGVTRADAREIAAYLRQLR